MTEKEMIKDRTHFGFIGFGLIGGTIAKALRNLYPDSEISAYNYYREGKHPSLEKAKEEGILNCIYTELSSFQACDVLFLCAPVMKNVNYLKEVSPFLREDCLITDVGSVKGNIYSKIIELHLEKQFVGGHPMTGSEKTGYSYSDAGFLKEHYYVLTPTPETEPEYLAWMEHFVRSSGSKCMILDPKTHDEVTAGISHVPHVISAALVNTVSKLDEKGYYAELAAGGFHSVTRISSSSPEMWENICLTNKDCILTCLDSFIRHLEDARDKIMNGEETGLTEFFTAAKKYRDNITQK